MILINTQNTSKRKKTATHLKLGEIFGLIFGHKDAAVHVCLSVHALCTKYVLRCFFFSSRLFFFLPCQGRDRRFIEHFIGAVDS